MSLRRCASCGSEHIGRVPCGMTWAERVRTIRIDPGALTSRDRKSYYDRSALDEAFGPDRREQMLEESRGLGPIQRAADGSEWVYHDPATREMRPLESSDLQGGYLRGETVDEEG